LASPWLAYCRRVCHRIFRDAFFDRLASGHHSSIYADWFSGRLLFCVIFKEWIGTSRGTAITSGRTAPSARAAPTSGFGTSRKWRHCRLMSASLIGRLGQALSGYPSLQCRCRSRARASLRTRHQGPSLGGGSFPPPPPPPTPPLLLFSTPL